MIKTVDSEKLKDLARDTRTVPWAGIGQSVAEATDITKALALAKLDWEVNQYPMFVDYKAMKDNPLTGDEQLHTATLPTGMMANVREDNRQVLGIVSPNYKLVQNRDALDFVDHIPNFTMERAGVYSSGAKIWLAGKFDDDIKIADDTIAPNVIFFNSFDGNGSVKIAITPIRLVCSNALAIAMKNAEQSWSIRHMGDTKGKIALVRTVMNSYHEYADAFRETADELLDIKVSTAQVEKIVSKLWVVPNNTTMAQEERIFEIREEAMNNYRVADLNNVRGTGWGVVNAISDTLTHMQPIRKSDTRAERLMDKVVNVHPILQQTVELLLAS